MPVHDWTRVDAGVFHDFHVAWIGALRNALNGGLLPPDYFAMAEQHAGKYIPDVLTLHTGSRKAETHGRGIGGGLALADAPPKVRQRVTLSPTAKSRRRSLAIRHVGDHRLVALMEIVSQANKDRKQSVDELVTKMEDALAHGINLLIVDLFPPGRHDSKGMHGAFWERLGDDADHIPAEEPVTLASYVADPPIDAFIEHVAVGNALPDMPLFLDPDYYINVPLEETYQITWRGTPLIYRQVLEARKKTARPNHRRRRS